MTAEDVVAKWKEITDFDRNSDYPVRADETFSKIMEYRDSIKPKLWLSDEMNCSYKSFILFIS